MRCFLVFMFLFILIGNSYAVTPDEALSHRVFEKRAYDISAQLRCLVCQGQGVNDSNAEFATDVRRLVRERVTAGDTDAQVFTFIQERYGDVILMNPPIKESTYALWFIPLGVFVLALSFFAGFFRKQSGVKS